MSREKQIDEIAKLICTYPQCICYNSIGECANTECQIVDKAEALYTADYRKQSEVDWYVNYMMSKKPSKRGRIIQYTTYTCSVCGKPNGRKKSKFCPECGAKMKNTEN